MAAATAGGLAGHRAVLGLPEGGAGGEPPGEEAVRRAWRRAAARLHPDKGGCPREFARARGARDALLAALARHRAALRAAHRPAAAPRKDDPPRGAAPGARPRELRQGEDGAELVPGEDLGRLAEEALGAGELERAEDLSDAALAFGRPPAVGVHRDGAGAAGEERGGSPLIFFGRLYLLRARARGARGRWVPALEDCERATRMLPRLPEAWATRGVVAGGAGRWAEAARCLARAEDLLAVDQGALPGLAEALAPLPLPLPTTETAADLLTRLVGGARAELLRRHCVTAIERAHGSCPGRGGDGSGGEPMPVHGLAFQPAVGTRGVDDGPKGAAGQEADPRKVATLGADGSVAVFSVPAGERWCFARPQRGGDPGTLHFAGAAALVWSPDGSDRLATASEDGTAQIWGVGRNRLDALRHFRGGHSAPLTHAAFSPDGIRLATCSADGSTCVWDAGSGLLEHALLPAHRARVNDVVFSPCGGLLVTASDDETARVWELRSGPNGGPGLTGRLPGECLHTLSWDSGAVNHVSFSPCGRFVVIATHRAAAGKRCYRILVWSAVSGRICRWYDGHHGLISSLSWRPPPPPGEAGNEGDESGDVLASGGWDGTLRLWRITAQPTGAGYQMLEMDEFRGAPASGDSADEVQFSGAVLCCAFLPAAAGGRRGSGADPPEPGDLLLAGSLDGAVRVYDPDTGDCLHEWEGHTGGVRAAGWSPCGCWAATAGEDGSLRLWKAPGETSDGQGGS